MDWVMTENAHTLEAPSRYLAWVCSCLNEMNVLLSEWMGVSGRRAWVGCVMSWLTMHVDWVMRQGSIYPTAWRSSKWLNLTAFLGTADSEVHIVHISCSWLIWTIWTSLSAVPRKAVKFNHSLNQCKQNCHPGKWIWATLSSKSNIDGLVQECSISSASAMERLQFCTKPSI